MERTVVRIDKKLIKQAESLEKTSKRKPPKQIEYWAELGKQVEEKLSSSEIRALLEGRVQILIGEPVTLHQLAQSLEADRTSGLLASQVKVGDEWYETSKDIPGFLVRITRDGVRELGQFKDGVFEAFKPAAAKKSTR